MTNKYWVSMTDKAMSGWGKAKNKINKYVIECDNYSDAQMIARNARNRREMKYINICHNKPVYGKGYLVSNKKFSQLSGPWKKK